MASHFPSILLYRGTIKSGTVVVFAVAAAAAAADDDDDDKVEVEVMVVEGTVKLNADVMNNACTRAEKMDLEVNIV